MYKKIGAHPGTRKLYADKLAAQGLGDTLGDDMVKAYRAAMDAGRHTVDPVLTDFKRKYAVDWTPFLDKKWTDTADTAIPLAEWKRLAEKSPPSRTRSLIAPAGQKKFMTTVQPWAGAKCLWTGVTG